MQKIKNAFNNIVHFIMKLLFTFVIMILSVKGFIDINSNVVKARDNLHYTLNYLRLDFLKNKLNDFVPNLLCMIYITFPFAAIISLLKKTNVIIIFLLIGLFLHILLIFNPLVKPSTGTYSMDSALIGIIGAFLLLE